jgi:hypothetical protein
LQDRMPKSKGQKLRQFKPHIHMYSSLFVQCDTS